MENLRRALRGVAEELSLHICNGAVLGLGSGSTVAMLIEELSPILRAKKISVHGVPTSSQIELVAATNEIKLVPFAGSVDFVVDGADQVDGELNLIKGGGGALLKEKVVMGAAKSIEIVAAEGKFSRRLCEKGVRVPVEVLPMARQSVRAGLSKLGGKTEERLLPKGYPYFTENGNVILDVAFEPMEDPRQLEINVKSLPGVAEVGIFTFKPITVFKLRADGSYDALE